MARGWESKEVESQIEAARERLSFAAAQPKSPQQVAFERERESLELSRTRVVNDLATASNPKYREQLQRSLDFLNEKLSELAAGSAS